MDVRNNYYANFSSPGSALQTTRPVIVPPKTVPTETTGKRYTRIVIDSKDRETSKYPNVAEYDYNLDEEINDVLAVELISLHIPFSMYMINQYFDSLKIWNAGQLITVKLTHGDYTETTFAQMLTSVLTAQAPKAKLSVTYNATKDKFIFQGNDGSYSFDFTGSELNSLHELLGFKKGVMYNSDAATQIEPPYRKNFNFNNYIIMTLKDAQYIKSNGKYLNNALAVIPKPNSGTQLISEDNSIIKVYNPPIPRLSKLSFRFTDRYGNLYDFQNLDHRIELEFTSHRYKKKYTT